MIHCRSQILQRIQKRSVQIKYDNFIPHQNYICYTTKIPRKTEFGYNAI